jgi:hypothetical protein
LLLMLFFRFPLEGLLFIGQGHNVGTDRLQTSLSLQRFVCRVRYLTLPQKVTSSNAAIIY